MLPVLDFSNTLAELDYLASKGFRAAMLPATTPVNLPKSNDEAWDPVFPRSAALGTVFVMHTGHGLATAVAARRTGPAVLNYANPTIDAPRRVMYSPLGCRSDRNPAHHAP